MVIVHAGLNDSLNLKPHQEITKTLEEMAAKFPDVAIQVCTQPEIPAVGMVMFENFALLNEQIDIICSRHPENMELVDLRWTKEKIQHTFNNQHYTVAAGEAVAEQLAKRTKAFL
ncbi:unnamed protein product, partial [Ixodes pacificus]